MRISGGGSGKVGSHSGSVPEAIGVVGGGVERVFQFAGIATVAVEVRVVDHRCEGVVGIVGGKRLTVAVGRCSVALALGQEEEVIVSLVEPLKVGIVADEAVERAFGQRIVAQFVLLDDAGFDECIADELMRLLLLLGREGHFRQIELALERVGRRSCRSCGFGRFVGSGLFGVFGQTAVDFFGTQPLGRQTVASGFLWGRNRGLFVRFSRGA